MFVREMSAGLVTACVVVSTVFGGTMEVFLTHPYGGIHKIDSSGVLRPVLADIGRCTGLEFDREGNLFFGRFDASRHAVNLMMMSPDRIVTNLGLIIQVGSVTHAVDIDIAVNRPDEIFFSHPDGGIRKLDPGVAMEIILPQIGELASLELGCDDNLYMSRYYNDRHRCDLLVSSSGRDVADWGDIIAVGAVTLAFDVDLAIDASGDVYFTHPYGGIYKRTSEGQIQTVLGDVGRCTGLAFDNSENLYLGAFRDDRHRIELFKMSPEGQVSNLGNIVHLGPVSLRWHGDIAVIPEPGTFVLLGLGGLGLLRKRRL